MRHVLLTLGRVDIIQILNSIQDVFVCTFRLRMQVWIHYYNNDEGYDSNLNVSVT